MDGLHRFQYICENGILDPTGENYDLSVSEDGRMDGLCTLSGNIKRCQHTIPFVLQAESDVTSATLNGRSVRVAKTGPGLFELTPPPCFRPELPCTMSVAYTEKLTDGATAGAKGGRWFEFQVLSMWKPLFSFVTAGRCTTKVRLTLPSTFHAVSAYSKHALYEQGHHRVYEWDTRPERYIDFAFIAGEASLTEQKYRDIRITALTDPAAQVKGSDVLRASRDILQVYEGMLGDFPFGTLSIACPPSSLSGNCARAGLVIAGLMKDNSPLAGWGYSILAHEISHSWWGTSVAFDYAKMMGPVESLAAYSTVRAQRHHFGADEYRSELAKMIREAKKAEEAGVPLAQCAGSTPNSEWLRESKGACVLLLLEREAGTARLDSSLRGLIKRSKDRFANLDDFHRVFTDAAGEEGDRLFRDYVLSTVPVPETTESYLP